jgi:hypothetical protein
MTKIFGTRLVIAFVAGMVVTSCASDNGRRAPWLCQIGENLCKQSCGPMRAEQAIQCRQSCEQECNR